jgi:hypothetical protein
MSTVDDNVTESGHSPSVGHQHGGWQSTGTR